MSDYRKMETQFIGQSKTRLFILLSTSKHPVCVREKRATWLTAQTSQCLQTLDHDHWSLTSDPWSVTLGHWLLAPDLWLLTRGLDPWSLTLDSDQWPLTSDPWMWHLTCVIMGHGTGQKSWIRVQWPLTLTSDPWRKWFDQRPLTSDLWPLICDWPVTPDSWTLNDFRPLTCGPWPWPQICGLDL